jgi:hypothetical protein
MMILRGPVGLSSPEGEEGEVDDVLEGLGVRAVEVPFSDFFERGMTGRGEEREERQTGQR